MRLLEERTCLTPSADYLYARLGCRRRKLAAESRAGGDPRRRLRREYRWIYQRLDERLWRALQPLFEYAELSVVVLALRYLSAAEPQPLGELLTPSLLAREVRRILLAAREPVAAMLLLERLLETDYPVFHGLSATWLRHGPGGVEQQLLGGYLQWAAQRSRVKPVRELLGQLLDMRNLLALYKHLQWRLPLAPTLLDGGSIPLGECQRLWLRQDMPGLLQRVRRHAGFKGTAPSFAVDEVLEQGISARLNRQGREPLQIGVLLDFLWRCRLNLRITPVVGGGAPMESEA